jgi:glycosyltransferase involved in cell wall biosynthesis
MSRGRILILVDWFAPGYKAGGPIQSCVNLALALKDDFEIFVLTTDTDHGDKQPYDGIVSDQWINFKDTSIKVFYARKSSLNASLIKREIQNLKVDFVYLNHLFSPLFVLYPAWLKFKGSFAAKMIVCPRGALYDSALAVKNYKKKPVIALMQWLNFKKWVTFHATNEREKIAIDKFFPGSSVIIADNLPNLNQERFSTTSKSQGQLSCIFIARIVAIKNLLFLLKILKEVNAKIQLTVVGPVEDEAYWKQCEDEIAKMPSQVSIKYMGPKRNDELAALIQQHHIFVLPTAGENFGHSIFEALLAGRPVLISDQTPWLKLEEKMAGWDLSLNRPETFKKAIEDAAGWDQHCFDQWSHAAWNYASRFIQDPERKSSYLRLFL